MKIFFSQLLNIPNILSLIRVLCAPLLAWFWLGLEWYIGGLVIGTIVGLTDLLDGVIARALDQTTELGALIDQLGDLVFESTCLLIGAMVGELHLSLLIVYLFREFTVMVVRSYVVGKGGTLPSTLLGKAKSSFLQWAFFPFFLGLILNQPGVVPESWTLVGIQPGSFLVWLAQTAIITGLILGLISAWIYLASFAKFYTKEQQAK